MLALLRQQKKSGDAGDLAHWQKETGRQVAAQFYDAGDFRSALTIYQTLATLDPSADWQWPIVYEIGLCFERLNLPDRAREAYAYLLPPLPRRRARPRASEAKLPPALEAIRGMAKWRQEHLAWQQTSGARIQELVGFLQKPSDVLPSGSAVPVTKTPPPSASAGAPTAAPRSPSAAPTPGPLPVTAPPGRH